MPIDRAATLRSAEKLLRQGKLEPAIAEYLRIIKEQPRDWNTANIVGDLYVRAGKTEQAVEQFVAIADTLRAEGSLPKASALYMKVLRLRPEHEHALLRCADIAAEQGVLVDARTFLKAVADRRRTRGDKRGAAEIGIRLGTLDSNDYPARIKAALMRLELDDRAGAFRDLQGIAVELLEKGRPADAAASLSEAAALAPDDPVVRGRMLVLMVKAGQVAEARAFAQTAGELQTVASELELMGRDEEAQHVTRQAIERDPNDERLRARLASAGGPLLDGHAESFQVGGAPGAQEERPNHERLLAVDEGAVGSLSVEGGARFPQAPFAHAPIATTGSSRWPSAERHFLEGRPDEGRVLMQDVLRHEPERRQDVALLGLSLSHVDPDLAFQLIDLSADAAIAAGDWESAAAGLQELVTRVPSHLPALMRLVEISVDGGLSATMYSAQAQLADAYLEAGAAREARFIAEDLVAREPWERVHLERFRRALVLLGEPDPEGTIASRLAGEAPFISTDAAVSATAQSSLDEIGDAESRVETVMPALTPEIAVESAVVDELAFWASSPGAADLVSPPGTSLHLVDTALEVVAPEPFAFDGPVTWEAGSSDARGEDEVDLNGALPSPRLSEQAPLGAATAASARAELDRVLAELRGDPARQEAMTAAERDFQQGLELFTAGEVDESITLLTKASSAPQLRFQTAALLARIHRDLGLHAHAIVWFEEAYQAPPPTPEQGHALLYDFADLLETTGARARATETFADLHAEAPEFRDVAERWAQLMPVAARR